MQNRSNPNILIKALLQNSLSDTFKNTLKIKFCSLNVIQITQTFSNLHLYVGKSLVFK